MALPFDAAVAESEYSVQGRRFEINEVPIIGINDFTGGGVTIEGQTYMRGADGKILCLSAGIETPQDITMKLTVGSWKQMRSMLEVAALALGYTGNMLYRHAPIKVVEQFISGNPLATPYTETMICKIAGRVPEMPNTGENAVMTITLKQAKMPEES